MKSFFLLLIALIITVENFSQTFYSQPFAHTYSIIARDSITGEMGVAVQSHWFSVGSIVAWGEAGVGVIATQSFVNVSFGLRGLELLKQGLSPQQVVDSLIYLDEGRDFRQLAVMNNKGITAAYTGKKCIDEAGHINKKNFSVQANMMLKNTVWDKMSDAFQKSNEPLAERMIAALQAAQAEGGDIRGQQSASIIIYKGEASGKIWEDKLMDLRVEDHKDPVNELKRLVKVHRAYEHMNKGDLAIEKGDMEGAMKEYALASKLFPENVEMKYWAAITLINNGKIYEALPMLKHVFDKDPNWRTLTSRLPKSELLNVDEPTLKKILSIK
ncbi:MAG: Zn-dependent protease [Chlorobiaceae bacterium]|nr:Zn-dependent protease [Chlorobiaceae bacterium]